MAEYRVLKCDKCRREARAPVHGWISSKPTKGSSTETAPPPTGDFCSVKCLVDYFSVVMTQASMDGALDEASARLDEPGPYIGDDPPNTARADEGGDDDDDG